MSIYDWLPTALLAAALWLCRNLIATRLVRSVQHEFDQKLANLNSQLRANEELVKADLRSKEAAIAVLQGAPISGMAARQAITDKRRIEAVDQIWEAVHGLGFAKVASQWMAVIKFEAALKEAARNPDFRRVFAAIAAPEDGGAAAFALATKARPHISQLAWAYFSAWQAIVLHATVQIKLLQVGLDAPETIESKGVINLVSVALPHRAAYIREHGPGAAYHLLEELETNLLDDLRQTLEGKKLDITNVQRANEIQKEAQRLANANEAPVPVPEAFSASQ